MSYIQSSRDTTSACSCPFVSFLGGDVFCVIYYSDDLISAPHCWSLTTASSPAAATPLHVQYTQYTPCAWSDIPTCAMRVVLLRRVGLCYSEYFQCVLTSTFKRNGEIKPWRGRSCRVDRLQSFYNCTGGVR